jgi:hypothetical protein
LILKSFLAPFRRSRVDAMRDVFSLPVHDRLKLACTCGGRRCAEPQQLAD